LTRLLRRTKAVLIYRWTGDLRAVQLSEIRETGHVSLPRDRGRRCIEINERIDIGLLTPPDKLILRAMALTSPATRWREYLQVY
jgi:hypothetical protein